MSETTRSWQPVPLPADAPAPAGAYSPVVRAGNLIFVSGQIPKDPRTGQIVGSDVRAQTRATLGNVRTLLHAAECDLEDVVSVTVHLANANDWGDFDATYREFFKPPFPTRTVVGAQLRDILVEITVIAMRHDRPVRVARNLETLF